jgi:hypothetical protein
VQKIATYNRKKSIMEQLEAGGGATTLRTLHTVFDGSLEPSVVEEVYQAEGSDMKLCCEVLWYLTPEASLFHRCVVGRS